MIRARFYIRKDDCDNDYRPVKWTIKYPYWWRMLKMKTA